MGAASSKWCGWPTKATRTAPSDLVLTFDSSEAWRHYFNSIKDSSQLVVVEFTDPDCEPCTIIEPDVLRLASKYTKIQFIKMQAIDVMDVAKEYMVRATPTFVFIRKGEQVERVKGAFIEDLLEAVRKHNSKVLPPLLLSALVDSFAF